MATRNTYVTCMTKRHPNAALVYQTIGVALSIPIRLCCPCTKTVTQCVKADVGVLAAGGVLCHAPVKPGSPLSP